MHTLLLTVSSPAAVSRVRVFFFFPRRLSMNNPASQTKYSVITPDTKNKI